MRTIKEGVIKKVNLRVKCKDCTAQLRVDGWDVNLLRSIYVANVYYVICTCCKGEIEIGSLLNTAQKNSIKARYV